MTYTVRDDVALKPLRVGVMPSVIVELDTSDLVALRYEASRTHVNTLSCQAIAWLVDADGDAQANVDGRNVPVMTEYRHNASAVQLADLSAETLATELTRLVLGEPATEPSPIPWPQSTRDAASIRNAIAVARASGELGDISQII